MRHFDQTKSIMKVQMEYCYIYGAILIDREYQKSVDFLKFLGEDESFPYINSNMFNLADYENLHYYEDPMITFGSTYKYFGLEKIQWEIFILKIEHLLKNIDFRSAQFHIQSSIGDFNMFWANKETIFSEVHKNYQGDYYRLIKNNNWYFGFGIRDLHTATLKAPLNDYENFDSIEITYPIELNSDNKKIIDEFINKTNT